MSTRTPADLELLSAYLDGELTPDERAALERRLAQDAALRAELDELRRVVGLVRAHWTPVHAPRDFRLDPAVYGRPAARPVRQLERPQRTFRWAWAVSAAAALLLVVCLASLLLRPSAGNVFSNFAPNLEGPASVPPASAPQEGVAALPTATALSAAATELPPDVAFAATVVPTVAPTLIAPTATLLVMPITATPTRPTPPMVEAEEAAAAVEEAAASDAVETGESLVATSLPFGAEAPPGAAGVAAAGGQAGGPPPTPTPLAQPPQQAAPAAAMPPSAPTATVAVGLAAQPFDESDQGARDVATGTPETLGAVGEAASGAASDIQLTAIAISEAFRPTMTAMPTQVVLTPIGQQPPPSSAPTATPSLTPLPTATATPPATTTPPPTPEPQATPQAGQDIEERAPAYYLDPGMLVGGVVVVLVVALVLFGLYRRSRG